MKNVEEAAFFGDEVVYLFFLNAEEYLKLSKPIISSVHCFPIQNEEVLFTVNQRGLDIIGGHIEQGETPEQALIREAMEEASIAIKEYTLLGAIRVDNRENTAAKNLGYPEIGYQLFYAVTDFHAYPFKADFESIERRYVKFSEISLLHHHWLNTHDQILSEIKYLSKTNNKMKF